MVTLFPKYFKKVVVVVGGGPQVIDLKKAISTTHLLKKYENLGPVAVS